MTVVLLGASLIRSRFPEQQSLQHVPTIMAILGLVMAANKDWLSPVSFACLIGFLWLHLLGARYLYSYVPYDDWSLQLLGFSLSDQMGWQRNHYERLVHFCFGALCLVPVCEIAYRRGKNLRMAIPLGFCVMMAASALYEIFE